MDDGTKAGYGLRLCTNCFTVVENQLLCQALANLYGIKATSILVGHGQYNVYIHSASMSKVAQLVKPYYTFSQYEIDFNKYST